MVNYTNNLSMVVDKELVHESLLTPEFVYHNNSQFETKNIQCSEILELPTAYIWDNVLTEEECSVLIEKLESSKSYSFWNPASQSKEFRNVDTIESNMNDFAEFLWKRIEPIFRYKILNIKEDDNFSEYDTIGEWEASTIYPKMLFGRYSEGGHFGPHTDGSVSLDINTRTFWTILIYLNTIPTEGGGATVLVDKRQKSLPFYKDKQDRDRSYPEFILSRVQPKCGRVLTFSFADMHEGEPISPGFYKYIIRTDVIFKRKDPILTSTHDQEAYKLWLEAQEIAEKGDPYKAVELFKKSFRLSPKLAELLKC
ncbi:uncharacterized protein CMU_001510 [Cryptosporidium muris RN66]|uniref:Fe2OG dioxygenase domain-containing protein n=1 Tax=Cryptosporidium muris (strain RN66) TaxID=441375 RepID=B6AGD9_CRYMR|nr:uncharacterized protein CMU_001510 [Cryptosporidium muris RN66]EEA07280.1 hypothetical protein, conserved [Cryptosporidium muris RN66]|eukprot:XP_002141629.1 hypothetical protein [Cryptosporidium muris RN66]